MTLHVSTSRFLYRGPDRLDVSRMTAGDDGIVFAPSWTLLRGALSKFRAIERARMSAKGVDRDALERRELDAWHTYEHCYTDEMRRSYVEHRPKWEALLARERVVLVCYCAERSRCHRGLLAGILAKLGAEDLGEIDNEAGSKQLKLL